VPADVLAKVPADVLAKVPADVLAKVPADVIAKVPAEVPDPKQLFRRFAQYYKRYDHDKSFTEIRTHALWFAKRARLGPKARDKICRARDLSIILGIFDNFDN
ncbi:hypothetical protein JXB31_05345, partial [Candidatus Woesearchaeota archaeon]|nr:hypothetical protein [Candidatus Woesearchaeota archaeon]